MSAPHPRDPPCGAVGPCPPRHRSAALTRTSRHTRCCWKDTEPQSRRGTACVPGAALWVEERGPTRSGAKKENGCTESPEQSPGRLHCPEGDAGSTPQGQADEGGAGASLGRPHTAPARGDSGPPAARPPFHLCAPHHQQVSGDWRHFQAPGSEMKRQEGAGGTWVGDGCRRPQAVSSLAPRGWAGRCHSAAGSMPDQAPAD